MSFVNGEEDYFVNLRAHYLLTEQCLVRGTQEQPVKAPKVVGPSLERRLRLKRNTTLHCSLLQESSTTPKERKGLEVASPTEKQQVFIYLMIFCQ